MTIEKRFKHFGLMAVLLVMAGCGCGDDSVLPSIGGDQAENVVFNLGALVPPCELTPPNQPDGIMQIDVFMVIDDSFTMNFRNMGIIPTDLTDPRKRTEVAQQIMINLEAQIMQDLATQYGITLAEAQARFDLAFGVGYLCDFGGPFAGSGRNFPTDAQARPFTLSMPVIRQRHPLFNDLFQAAILVDTPGEGHIIRTINGQPVEDTNDPQTSIEALYQIATGDGFDGNGANGTLDSGPPCALTTQTAPGDSGDVPAATFNATQDETDPDGRPVFYVRDEGGNTTQIPDPANAGATIPCFASGNLGGVGWRNEAARFVILTSDVATVAPFPGDPVDVSSNNGSTPTVPGTVGPATGPRLAATLPSAAFDSSVGRIGNPATDALIAPTNAATVPATIAALNNLHIEVLNIGYPRQELNHAKPNGGVNPGDTPPGTEIPEVRAGVGPHEYGNPTIFPWTFMSAVSLLTGSEITYNNSLGRDENFPAVYNAGTVARRDQPITDHVREDLVQRIQDWADNGFLNEQFFGPGSPGTVNANDLPTMTMPVTLTLLPSGTFNTNFVETLGSTFPNTVTVQVPVFATGGATPASAPAQFPDIGYSILDLTPPAPRTVTDTLQYQIVADLSSIVITPGSSGTPASQQLADALRLKVGEWTEAFGSSRTMTDASLIVTLEEFVLNTNEAEAAEVTVQTVTEGCGFLNVVQGDGGPAQVGAPCNPFATLP